MLNKLQIENLLGMRDEAEKRANKEYQLFKATNNAEHKEKSQHYLTVSDLCNFLLANDTKYWHLPNLQFNDVSKYFED